MMQTKPTMKQMIDAPSRDFASEVGAEREEAERHRDEAHHLAEDAGRADGLDRAEHPFVPVSSQPRHAPKW